MSVLKLPETYRGKRLTIKHCKGALKSFEKAMSHVEARKKLKFTAAILSQLKKLADEGPEALSTENFPWEGDLPKTGKFRALKRIPIRGYCWSSTRCLNTYFISHYIFKDQNKLDPLDSKKVIKNWKRIEEEGNEL